MIKFKCHWTEIFTTTKKAKFQFHAGSTLAANAAVTQTLSPRLKEKSKTIRLILLLLNFGSVVFFRNLKAYNGVLKTGPHIKVCPTGQSFYMSLCDTVDFTLYAHVVLLNNK